MKRLLLLIGYLVCAIAFAGCAKGAAASSEDQNEIVQSLEAVSAQWETYREGQQIKSRLGENARCYVEVADTGADTPSIKDRIICGPYREMAGETTVWDIADIASTDAKNPHVFGLESEPESAFQKAPIKPDGNWWAGEGASPDFAVEVAEPDAETAEFGEIVETSEEYQPELHLADPIVTPDGKYFCYVGAAERVGGPTDRRMVIGGFFVTVKLQREASLDDDYEVKPQETELTISSGGQSFTFPTDKTLFSMAVPGDAADAKIQFTFQEVTQELTTGGSRIDQPNVQGMYLAKPDISVTPTEAQIGRSFQDGWYFKAKVTNPKVEVTGWVDGAGWAPDNQVWVVIRSELNLDGPKFFYGYDQATYLQQPRYLITDAFLGNSQATVRTLAQPDQAGNGDLLLVFPLDAEDITGNLNLYFTVTVAGNKDGDTVSEVPSAATQSLIMATKVKVGTQ